MKIYKPTHVLRECVKCGNAYVIKNGIDGNTCECGGYLKPKRLVRVGIDLAHKEG